MAILTQYLAYDYAELQSFKSWTQGISNAFNTFGWLPSNDGGAVNSTGNYGTGSISLVQLLNNVLQITFGSPTNEFAPGQVVLLNGLTTNTFLNGQYVRITNTIGSQAYPFTSGTTNGVVAISSVASSVGSTAVYTLTTTQTGSGATANFFAGITFVVAGFVTHAAQNNGTFVCTASTSTTLTLYNSAAIAETQASTGTQQPDRTNTLFTAMYAHADVTSVSDTGTATAVYNYNTLTAPVDQGNTGYSIKQPKKFRGNWVGVTPVFTQLQTTNNQTTLTFGANGHGLDLTRAVGQGMRVTGVANASFTWLNDTGPTSSINTYSSGWPITSLTSTTVVINTGSSPRADIAGTAVTAGFASPWYVGCSSDGTVATDDTVLYGGDLFECTFTTAGGFYGFQGTGGGGTSNGSGTGATPGTDTTKWRRIVYELWTSNDTLSSTNRLYFRLQYSTNLTAQIPILWVWFGSASDGNGNISVNQNWGTSMLIGNTVISGSAAVITGAALWECNFSGASGRFSLLMWRGFQSSASVPTFVLSIERSHDNSGNDTDAYWTVVYCGGVVPVFQQSVFKPGSGGAGILEFGNPAAIKTVPIINGQALNNSLPVLPVFPMVGFMGNPLLGVVSFSGSDVSEGGLISITMYGTTHPFLCSKAGGTQTGGPANFGYGNAAAAGVRACAIRWE